MTRSKRLKQIKHKRQTNHKRQTKHKRHRQYGGTKYRYNSDSISVLKVGAVTEPVLIPGYSEILDMMEEYKDGTTASQKLIIDIKSKDVKVLSDCSETQVIENQENRKKIIVLRKTSKSFIGVTLGNNTIDCSNDNYHKFASHNFSIFIEDILKWNPFLNQPAKELNKQPPVSYRQNSMHEYKSDHIFKDEMWWNKQGWWLTYSNTTIFRAAAAAAAAITVEAAITGETKERLVESLTREIARLEEQMIEIKTKIQVKKVELLHAQQQPAEQQLRQQEQ